MGKVAYKLVLPISMKHIHEVFHASSFCKYIGDPSHVLKIDEVQFFEDLSYEERPIQILDGKIKQLINR